MIARFQARNLMHGSRVCMSSTGFKVMPVDTMRQRGILQCPITSRMMLGTVSKVVRLTDCRTYIIAGLGIVICLT
jgi:hypothetical protein